MSKKPRPSMLSTLWKPRANCKTSRGHASRRRERTFEPLEARNMLAITTFTDVDGGYSGTQDTVLYSIFANVNFGADTGISVDQQDVAGERQGLLKFDNIIGNGIGQIPLGSTINSATLTVSVFNDSNASMQISMYRMLVGWNQDTATWNSFGAIGGVQASENEATGLPPDALLFKADTGIKTFDVTTSLKHWASGESNFGWLFESAATNGWDFNTSESDPASRPILSVNYTPPSGAGQFQFLNVAPSQAEGDSGPTTAMVQISRLGGTSGAASVDVNLAPAASTPASAGSDYVDPGTVTVSFADGQSVATIPITITGDTTLEGLEKLTVTLSNATGGAGVNMSANVATLTILDDDALINEVLANVSNAADESNREYIELVGTPGASLAGYFFVGFESEEEENSGVADIVIDLGTINAGAPATFGANGLLVITPMTWGYQSLMDPMTNQVKTGRLDGIGGRIEDSSQTFALIRSTTPLVEGTDYDTVGVYADSSQLAASSDDLEGVKEGLEILDTGPFAPGGGGQMIDSVGVVEGGGNDRDRVLTTRESGHPGVHVHQPDGSGAGNANVASDAVTRRLGQKTPSTIGVWYNGDIPDGAASSLAYRVGFQTDGPDAGKTVSSVVTPPGATLTPGSANRVRSVFLTETEKTVDENVGTVTLMVTRLDTGEAITVNYTTIDGTAKAGQDYTLTSGQLSFGVGEATKPIVVPISQSVGTPEGFETFTVRISNPTAPSVVTTSTATVTIRDLDVLTKTYQEGVDGYVGTHDTTLNSIQPTDAFGLATTVLVDEQAGTLTGPDARPAQGLLRFNDLFGVAGNQIPSGSTLFGGFVTLFVTNPSDAAASLRFFRMLNDWDEGTATWSDPQGSAGSSIINGVTPDDVEASTHPDLVPLPGKDGEVNIPIDLDILQAWSNGTLANYGWSIVSNTANDWLFTSADAGINQPKLTLFYTSPTASQGTFGFSDDSFNVNEGSAASLTVNRVGGSTGAATVDWTITLGTAAAGDITGTLTGSVAFANGELSKTITIPTAVDVALERNETLSVALSGTGIALNADRTTTTLTIRDNDFSTSSPSVLLNEVLVNSPGLDSGQEYIELSGTANAGMGSLYVVIINGDVGEGEGSSDLVIDLGAYANGASTLTIVKALNNFGFRVPSDTTQVSLAALNAEIISNDSATYALVYSPQTSLFVGAYDYDWDNDGSLDLPTGAAIVDSVAIKDNGALDFTYGPSSNAILSSLHPNIFVADGISRLRGNTNRNNATAWFRGDLTTVSSTGDDQLVYDATNNFGLPVTGAAMTPGEINTGTTAQSPLVSLTAITPNAPVGTVTLTFNGPISQFLDQGGFPGVTIGDTLGSPIAGVDPLPGVAGLGTNTLTLSFTGSAVSGGVLPVGTYQLNFTGNSLIGNGRAVDTANTATAAGSNRTFQFTVSAPHAGDYNGDGHVEGFDFLAWQRQLGSHPTPMGSGADGDNSGTVDAGDLTVWSNNFGLPVVAASVPEIAAAVMAPDSSTVDSALVDLAQADAAFRAIGSRHAAGRPSYRPSASPNPSWATPLGATTTVAAGAPHRELDDLFAELGEDDGEELAGCGHALAAAI